MALAPLRPGARLNPVDPDPSRQPPAPTGLRVRLPDVVGVLWVVASAFAVLVPALTHGPSLGSYDILSQFGLTAHPGTVHNPFLNDPIDQMIPWSTEAWRQVHGGHLPLWNPYSLLGTPLAFNWQSTTFSVPALVGYLVPLRFVYTVEVLVTLVVAGTGAYTLARVLRVGVAGAALAGVAFELSGPFFAWVGWPIASVASWTGWILAGIVVVLSGRRRFRAVTLTGVAVACSVYGGQPDALVLLVLAVAVFTAVALALAAYRSGGRSVVRPVVDLGLAAGLGGLLAAPLLLPGAQLIGGSVRVDNGPGGLNSQHAGGAVRLVNGFVVSLVPFPNVFDFTYIGAAVVVLAVAALLLRSRERYVVPLFAMALLGFLLAYSEPVVRIFNALPGLHAVRLPRAGIFLTFGTALLGGIGLDVLARSRRRRDLVILVDLFAVAGLLLAIIWAIGFESVTGFSVLTTESYLWAAAALGLGATGAVLGLVATPGRVRVDRAGRVRRGVAVALVVVESAFVVAAGSNVWTADSAGPPQVAAVARLQQIVGSSLVGLGAPLCEPSVSLLGIGPNANVLYRVHQFAAYDPMLPRAYYTAWQSIAGTPGGYPLFSTFCPGVTSVALARRFGVSYVLEPAGRPGPPGTQLVATLAGQGLFRVRGVAVVTATAVGRVGSPPGGQPGARQTAPGTLEVAVRSAVPEVLQFRITDVPGWHATVDGRPLALRRWSGVMLEATVPAGRHAVELRYWPERFTDGLWLAAAGVVAVVTVGLLARRRRRVEGASSSGPADGPSGPPAGMAPAEAPVDPGTAQGVGDQIGWASSSAGPGNGPDAR